MSVVVGIDASRNRSGGARAHLMGLLGEGDPQRYGVAKVHVWSHRSLLDGAPDAPWLVKHHPRALGRSLWREAWWQLGKSSAEFRRAGCEIVLSLDAGTIGRFQPSVVMSRDMLSFEPTEIVRFGRSGGRLRLILLRYIQASSLRHASGALFLTRYAADVIRRYTGPLATHRVIPHGVGERFRQETAGGAWPQPAAGIRCVYVSAADVYKHQWSVVEAVAALRAAGRPITLRLVGAATGNATSRLQAALAAHDPDRRFVEVTPTVAHAEVASELARTDLFVFASSCENMPNTLLEAMAAGLPIACSNRGPMPEMLGDGGVYFDPEDAGSIAAAIDQLLADSARRCALAQRAKELSQAYSWARCARETWTYLADIARASRGDGAR
jgi:glycosyltransferase involved in cell wall biosynthesis